jgi:hypothetical protein
MKRMSVTSVVLAVVCLILVDAACAEAPATICVPEASSKQVLSTNTKGECPSKTISKVVVKYKSEALPSPAELEKLDKIMPHVGYIESGVGGKPTIQFSGVSVQIVNGEGKTTTTNGAGNLVIGYDDSPGEQTGSHNLILGEQQTFTSYGGIVAGARSTVKAPYASVISGFENTATAFSASVLTGESNTADESYAAVSGGEGNVASGVVASVQGGFGNTASGTAASIFGGFKLTATGSYEAIP